MSLVTMGSCVLLVYPVAWLLANLPTKSSNLLLIRIFILSIGYYITLELLGGPRAPLSRAGSLITYRVR